MSLADDLQKLEQLRSSGALSDDEFKQAKAKLIAPPSETPQNVVPSDSAKPTVSPFWRGETMRRLFLIVGSVVAICISMSAISMAQETLNNAGVIELKQAGLGDAVILNKIKASKCDFDISTDALKKLKEGGLSDDVITSRKSS